MSSIDQELQYFNQYERNVYDDNDYEGIPVVSDDFMFSEEANACNFLAPLVRKPEDGNIFCDSLYILEFLRRRRNTKNRALFDALCREKTLDKTKFQNIVRCNFEIVDEGNIESFWKRYRNADFNITELTEKRFATRFRSAKAFLFPCYMGDVESGDTSRSHVVLFVAYVDNALREIHMYDSLIKGDKPKRIERFDCESIQTIDDLMFKTEEHTSAIFIQKTFHLLESFLHCLELFDFKNVTTSADTHVEPVKIQNKTITIANFTPRNYTFFKSGYGKEIVQQYHNCSSFVTYGMYNILRNWTNFSEPHRMKMKDYNELFDRPIITVSQYICAFITHYLFKQSIIIKKMAKKYNLSIQIVNNSNTEEDFILEQSLFENLKKCMTYVLNPQKKKSAVDITISDIANIDRLSMKTMVILIYDQAFNNKESIETTNQFLHDIFDTTQCLIIIYPSQAMIIYQKDGSFASSNNLKNFSLSSKDMKSMIEDIKCLTYTMPVFSSELARPNDSINSLIHSFKPDYQECDDIVIELPPYGTEFLMKPPGANFIPFNLS